MIDENRLTQYYSNIANKLEEIIPIEWDEIVMYAEEFGDVRAVHFYYKESNGEEYKSGGKIPDDYGVSTKVYFGLLRELSKIINSLWLEFINAGEEKWYTVTFKLDSDYKFEIKYGYKINRRVSFFERKICWAYEQLNIIPEDSFEKKILDEYLQQKEIKKQIFI